MSAATFIALAALAVVTAVFQRSMLTLARDRQPDPEGPACRAAALRRGRLAGSLLVGIALALVLGHVR